MSCLVEVDGYFWDSYWDESHPGPVWRAIPTNGTRNARGQGVIGRGLAKQAQRRYPEFRTKLGLHLKQYGNCVTYDSARGLFIFPVKHHWAYQAVLDLIADSARQLVVVLREPEFREALLLLPRVGCGNGGRDWEQEVRPILERELEPVFDKILVVYTPELEGE